MMNKHRKLVEIMADGKCHSGEVLGHCLDVSRAAVWKQLQQLLAYGLQVNSIKGKGYQLSNKIELLNAEIINSGISGSVSDLLSPVEILFSVESTNDYVASRRELLDSRDGFVCLAEHQANGRGRRGRRWVSPLGCNLYLSFIWRFEQGAAMLDGLSLAVGVAVVRALKRINVDGVGLKWPNDILLNEKKLGGVLLELSGDPTGRCEIICGIGINIGMDNVQPEIDQLWSSLDVNMNGVSRNQLAIEIINEVVALFSSFHKKGFAQYLDEWMSVDSFSGKEVSVIAGSSVTNGVAMGVAANGALLVDVDGKEQAFHGGELSLRLNERVGG